MIRLEVIKNFKNFIAYVNPSIVGLYNKTKHQRYPIK